MIDESLGIDVAIDHELHAIHLGESFKVDDLLNINTDTQLWLITTSNSLTYAHIIFDFLCTGEQTILITEGADRTTSAANLVPLNRRRVGIPSAATVIVGRGATGGSTNGATVIENLRIGATDKFSALAGESEGRRGYVLKPNTKYVVSVTTYADVWVTLRLHWCEHKDRRNQDHFNVE